MKTLVFDNTCGLTRDSFVESCFNLGIELEYRPKSKLYLKKVTEVFFRHFNHELKFHNEKVYPSTKSEINEVNPIKIKDSISLNHLHQLIHGWLIDGFAQTFIKKLGGIPSTLWKESEPFQWKLPFENTISLLPKVEGRIQRTGILFRSLLYLSSELQKLTIKSKYKKIAFYYDPRDLSVVYVYDSYEKRYLTVPCLNQAYSKGLSEHVHVKNLKGMKSDIDYAEIHRMKESMISLLENKSDGDIRNVLEH